MSETLEPIGSLFGDCWS